MVPSTCRLVGRQAASFTNYTAGAHLSIPLGIIIGLLASSIQSLGLTIQRKSHVVEQRLPESQRRVEHRRPLWLLGFTIFISSNVLGSFVQIASLPVVILAPLGAVSLLWNAFFARLILGDVFSPWMILGTVLIAGGAVLIAIFGIVPEPTRSLEDLLVLFGRPAFIVYFSVLGVVVLLCLIATHIIDYAFARRLSKLSAHVTAPSSDSCLPPVTITNPVITLTPSLVTETSVVTEQTPLLDKKATSWSPASSLFGKADAADVRSIDRTRVLLAVSYASFSGIISGMCLLFAKSGVELLLLTLGGQNQFWRWQAWVLVFGLVVFALLQLWYLHKALILADPTLVCPSAFCFYNMSSIANGLVYFDQFSLIPPLHLGLVVLGMVTLLGGVWVVSIQSEKKEVDDESDSEELYVEEEASESWDDSPHRTTQGGHVGPVAMDRVTRSEPNIQDLTRQHEHESESITLDGSQGQPRQSERLLSPERGIHGGSTLPLSRHAGSHYRRRTTVEYGVHGQGVSQHMTDGGYKQLSPPLLPMNTLSGGFQIGLSPVSPGFAIVPRERGMRRSSGLGARGDMNGVDERRERTRRRRTVSEGDIGRVVANDVEDVDETVGHSSTNTKGKERAGKRRWDWLRRMILK